MLSFARQFEQSRRQHRITVPVPHALLDPERHALTVNVGHDLGHAQARAIGDAEAALYLTPGAASMRRATSLRARHDWRPARLVEDLRGRTRSRSSSVTVKKNRNAAMAALIEPALICCCAICSWYRRRSSLVGACCREGR